MIASPHSELIATLTELYNLLDALGVVSHCSPLFPLHTNINAEAAHATGYASEAVKLMCDLPYLDVELAVDEGSFESLREMLHDEMMPPTALRLTYGELSQGTEFIYDTDTSKHCCPAENPDEIDDYYHVQGQPPRQALSKLINDYRTLNYIVTPHGTDFNRDFFSKSEGQPPSGGKWSEADEDYWCAQYNAWKATREIKNTYLDFGWNVDTVDRALFEREEFMIARDRYWKSSCGTSVRYLTFNQRYQPVKGSTTRFFMEDRRCCSSRYSVALALSANWVLNFVTVAAVFILKRFSASQ
ncbi:hypothetical protein E4T43_03505 [Aureobasidium subglaciale]|nr:hypothetical protein E4T43_03505 [Aureobasidium subglaciale]